MSTVNNHERPNVLVVTGGHPFEQEPYLDMFRANDGIDWAHAQPPSVRSWFTPDKAGTWDAMVCYDMQGFAFRKPELPELLTPPAEYAAGFQALLERGQGIVFLHHSMSAWPTWPLWARVVGGRWNYVPGALEGTTYPASGYTREIQHHISVLDPSHPVCAGLGEGFDIVDEIYLNPVLDDTFTPLLKSDYPMDSANFFSGELAMRDRLYENEGWSHPAGKGYMGWVKTAFASPIVYLQCGHGPAAYGNPGFRRLLSNAIDWVASPEAHEWARANRTDLATV
jgi:type 1 glutamine amidotransferase